MQLPIQNIYGGNDRKIWLFLRDENGNQIIKSDNTYTPYYFEPSNEPNPKFRGYDGTPLKIIPVSRPYEVRKFKTNTSWGNDIPYTTSYKIDKIDSYLKSPIKWLMIDTEQCVGNNDIRDYANNPFTAIASYCNFTNKYDAWAACDFSGSIKARETKILSFFIDYIKKEKPDIMCIEENTLVNTEFGQTPVRDLNIGDEVISFSKNNFIKSKIIHKSNEKRESKKITTRLDEHLVSNEHINPTLRWRVVDRHEAFFKNKKTIQLTDEDYLLRPINFLTDTGYRDDYHWLMGYYFGDGKLATKFSRYELTDCNKKMIHIAGKVLNKLGIDNVSIKKYDNYYRLYTSHQKASEILKKMQFIKKTGVVAYLQKLTTEHQLSFIGGFFDAEGTHNFSQNNITIGNTDKELLQFIRYVLFGIGIPTSFREVNLLNKKIKKFFYIIVPNTENNHKLYLKHPSKQRWIKTNYKFIHKDTIPIRTFLRKIAKLKKLKYPPKTSDRLNYKTEYVSRKLTNEILTYFLKQTNKKYDIDYLLRLRNFINRFHFDKIKSISNLGAISTVEVSLSPSPYFIANNCLTHNCFWNSSHDINYFHHRIQMRWNKVFAELISPIGQTRWAKDDIFLPAGISVVDYMGLYRKVEQKKGSYALNDVMEDELGLGKAHAEIDFNDWTNPELKERCREDVVALVEIEEKKKLIPYYDIVRRETTVDWEDLPMQVTYNEGKEQKISNNSKMIDMLVLREAKRRNIVLPNKNYEQDQEHIKGASRELDCPNRFMGVYQVDVSGCYPGGIIDFCLDTQNIIDNPEDYKGKYPVCKVGDYYFKQNSDALLPTVTRHWLALKDEFKQKKESMDKSDPDYVTIKTKYDALKGICNSLFGVIALKTFRLYDLRVAGAITWIGRSILDYADKRLRENGYKVLEKDTDGIKIHSTDPTLTDKCNGYVQEWSMSNYNRNSSLKFEKEGIYKTVFLKAMCHYFGYIDSGDGKLEEKMKGMEAKRGNSSKFVKTFQKKLIEKILELNEKEDNWLHSEQTIVNWIKSEIIRFKTLPLFEVAFPTTLKRPLENYTKKQEIFVRAVKNTRLIMPDFMPPLGSRFWWIHVKPNAPKVVTQVFINDVLTKSIQGDVAKKSLLNEPQNYGLVIAATDKIKILHEKTITDDVIAFDKKNYNHVKNIDYDVLIEKQIMAKVEPIFEPLGWDIKKISLLDTTPNNVV